MRNFTTATASTPNTKKKSRGDGIDDANSCIKAILIGNNIRQLKQQVEDGDNTLETQKKINELAEKYKAAALIGYTDKTKANQYLNY